MAAKISLRESLIRSQVRQQIESEFRSIGVDVNKQFDKWLDLQMKRIKIPLTYDPDKAEGLTAVQNGIGIIAGGVSDLPIQIFNVSGAKEELVYPSDDKEARVIANQWTEFISSMDAIYHLIESAILHGAGAAWVERGEFNQVSSIYPLDPTLIKRHRIGGRELVYHYSGIESDIPRQIKRSDLIFLPFKLPRDGVSDCSPFEKAWSALRAALCIQEFVAEYFGRGATPNLIFVPEAEMQPNTFKENLATFWSVFDRMRKSNRRELLAPVPGDVKVTGSNARDSDLSAQRTYGVQEVARILQIPSQVQESSRGTYSNYTQAERFLAKPLRRWAHRLQMEISNVIWPGRTRIMRFDTSLLVEEPMSVRVTTARAAKDSGFWSVNEAREYTGREVMEGEEFDQLAPSNAPQMTLQQVGVEGE